MRVELAESGLGSVIATTGALWVCGAGELCEDQFTSYSDQVTYAERRHGSKNDSVTF